MRKLFIFYLLFPLFIFSQNPLVHWFTTDFKPSLVERHLTASNMTVAGGVTLAANEYGTADPFFSTGNWPTGALDTAKYIEFRIEPEAGYKIKAERFAFSARPQGGTPHMQVRFSTSASFAAYQTIQSEVTVTGTTAYTHFDLEFPTDTFIPAGSKLFIRIYVYNSGNNNFHIQHNNSGSIGPLLSGSVSLVTPVTPVAHDDVEATHKNHAVTVDLLKNDDYEFSGPLTSLQISTGPAHGTVAVTPAMLVTYTPNLDYVGSDTFYYTITNGVGTSAPAKVLFEVVDGTETVLERWHTKDFKATNYITGITGTNIAVNGSGMQLKTVSPHWVSNVSNDVFESTGWPIDTYMNGTPDPSKYITFSVKSALSGKLVLLENLDFQFHSQASGKMVIKYSEDPAFQNEVYTLEDGMNFSNASEWKNVHVPFGPYSFLQENQTIYLRIYIFNMSYANAPFYIRYAATNEPATSYGPTVTGIVSDFYPEPCTTSTTWNGSGWSLGVPTADIKAVIDGTYNTAASGAFTTCSLTVNSNALLTVAPDYPVTVQNEITVKEGGDILVQSGGNLLQWDEELPNLGDITVERHVSDMNNVLTGPGAQMDYVYWSSPVEGQKTKGLDGFSPGTPSNRFYSYRESNDLFYETADLQFVPGKGYAIRAETGLNPATGQNYVNGYDKTYKFRGIPNNGSAGVPVKRSPDTGAAGDIIHGYNLIGNPYPSNINFEHFYDLNKNVIYPTAWFWTNNSFTLNQQGQGYTANNYAVYNHTGGTAATGHVSEAGNILKPDGLISVGQGFIIQVRELGAATVQFHNRNGSSDVRVASAADFYTREAEQKDRFWLNLISPDNLVNSQLIGYVAGATNGFEEGYDAELLSFSSDVFYSVLEDKNLQIQGRSAFTPDDKVILGANFFKNDFYTIALEQPEGIFATSQAVYLKDKETGKVTNLTENAYTFEAAKGVSTGRFEIVYQPETVLGADATARDEILVYRAGGDFVAQAKTQKISRVEVYDMGGRLSYSQHTNQTRVVIPAEKLPKSIYILKITQNERVTSRKIIK